jgi:hypothetical protein
MNALMDSIAPRDSFEVRYRLRAKCRIDAQGLASRGYDYYDPDERPPAPFGSLNAAGTSCSWCRSVIFAASS